MALQPYANVVYQYTQKVSKKHHATTGIECFATVICMIDAFATGYACNKHDSDTFKSVKCSLASLQITMNIEVWLI